jgi:integrase
MLNPTMPESSGDLKPSQPNRAQLVTDLAELTERCRQGLPSKVERFTRKVLAALVPAESGKDVFISTAELPCYYVRVTKDGHRSYCIQHRVTGRHTIGDVRVKTAEQALKRAQALLSAAQDGRSLLAEEKQAKRQRDAEQASTVVVIVEQYLAEAEIRRQRTFREKSRILRRVWSPIHEHSAETISRNDVLPDLRKIAHRSGGPMANRAKTTLAAMFSYAVLHGWLKRDSLPTNTLPRWEETPRERVLSLEELGKLWHVAPQVSEAYGAVVRLMALTGCRRAEIADLKWGEVDLEAALISLPGSRVKNKRSHLVPLAPAAVAILKARPPVSDKVFPGAITWSRAKAKLDKQTGFEMPFVIEDTRRSFSTGCREHLSPVPDHHLVELTIGHLSGSRGGVAGVYDRSERLAERRRLLERWADLVLRAAGEPVESAQVVNLR